MGRVGLWRRMGLVMLTVESWVRCGFSCPFLRLEACRGLKSVKMG